MGYLGIDIPLLGEQPAGLQGRQLLRDVPGGKSVCHSFGKTRTCGCCIAFGLYLAS